VKKLIRRPWAQAVLGWILWVVLVVTRRSLRWTHENLDPEILKDGRPCVMLFWHGRIPLALGIAQVWWARGGLRCMISPSADGEFIAQALARAKFPAIRVSSAKPGDTAKARAAVAGFREALEWVKAGNMIAITPDGPRGPNEVIAAGSLQLARRSGAPIYLVGVAADPCWRLDTWDKVMIAKPFGRGATVWDGPHYVSRDADEAAVAAQIAALSERLSLATRRAEVLAAGRPSET